MFGIITPSLIIGEVAERMKFAAVLVFVGVWMFAVYFPIAHMVWGIDGWMNGVWNPAAKITAIDFAGGTVVHMSSGWSALDRKSTRLNSSHTVISYAVFCLKKKKKQKKI